MNEVSTIFQRSYTTQEFFYLIWYGYFLTKFLVYSLLLSTTREQQKKRNQFDQVIVLDV